MSGVPHAAASRARLDEAWRHAPAHLRPVIAAVRDCGVGMLFVQQGVGAFRIPPKDKRPAVIILGDDMDVSRGPDGFHLPSVRRAIRGAAGFAVISSEATEAIYAGAAAVAVAGRRVLIVETRPAHEIPWVEMIQKLAPGRPLLWSTVKGGHA
jgi:hypothetical protein